jgi:hypothetical protein
MVSPALTSWIRPRLVAALLSLGALALAGCKQDLGQRCEQNSDCKSGFCGDGADMASAQGKQCVAVLGGPPLPTPTPTPSDGGEDADADAGPLYGPHDAADGVTPATAEVHAEVGAEAPTVDGASDMTEAGAD